MPDLRYEKFPKKHYATFTMDRPERLNAAGRRLKIEWEEALQDFEADTEMRCGIVTGAGRAFCAGADLKEMAEDNAARQAVEAEYAAGEITLERRDERLRQLAPPQVDNFRISFHPKPFIAAVNGLCIGGGMERTMACDIRIASTAAYFGLFEAKRGILAGYGIMHLARLMPYGDAMYLLLTTDRMSAEEALKSGFVREVVEPERLMPRAVEIAEMIAANAPLSIQGTKAMAATWRHMGMEEVRRANDWVARYVLESDDAKEGPRAFSEKREPNWTGR